MADTKSFLKLQRSFEQGSNDVHSTEAEVTEANANLQQEQDVAPAVPLQHDAFCLHFPKFIEYMLCKTIGDPGAYLKHLQKEKKNNNQAASAQIEAMLYFETLQNAFGTIEQKCAMIENDRFLTLFSSLRQQSSMPMKRQNYWSVCALTGIASNELIEIAPDFQIDAQFEALSIAVWLCVHLEAIEKSRMESFAMKQMDKLFISEIINVYLNSETAMCMCDIYCWAFEKIFKTFDKTLEVFSDIVRQAKTMPAI